MVAWAGELFEGLDAYRRPDFGQQVAAAADIKSQGPGALTQVDTAIERNRKLFSWNHITDAAYLAENARLAVVKSELVAAAVTATPPIEVEGLLDLAYWTPDDQA